jgi:hypothetical protein
MPTAEVVEIADGFPIGAEQSVTATNGFKAVTH